MNDYSGTVDAVQDEASVARNGQAPAAPPVELSRLIMVATSAWELPTELDEKADRGISQPRGHAELLRELLSTEHPGLAWIGADINGVVDYVAHGSAEAEELIRELDEKVTTTCAEVRTRIDRSRTTRRQDLAALRHRIVMDPARLHAVTRTEAGGDGDSDDRFVNLIAMDLRFDFHLDTPLCHLSLSVWSARPWHERYVPDGWPGERRKDTIPVADVPSYVARFHLILYRTIDLLKRHLVEADRRVYRRKNVLPLFWVPVPARQEPDAVDYQRAQPELRRELARIFLGLGDPEDCVATASVVNGQFDVLRRFRRGVRLVEPLPQDRHRTLSRAHYLIIPSRPPGMRKGLAPEERTRLFQTQEDQTADVVTKLTDLEARRASHLHEIHRDLLIWHNHLDVYDQVVERGTFLWDGLSAHLVTRRRVLRRVHHAVELLHQILLQGVGDIAQLANRTRDCVAQVQEAADQLHTDYDEALTERHEEHADGLRGALDRTGLFERVNQDGEQTMQEAQRVKTIYDDLLRTIGYAFDEWRVRESDVVQRLSAALGTVLGLLGVVTILDATVDLKPNPGENRATVLGGHGGAQLFGVLMSWGLGAVVLLAVAWLVYNWSRSGQLGSRHFGRYYSGRRFVDRRNGLWRLLKDISTDGLEKLVTEPGSGTGAFAKHDQDLASRFAALWDQASAMNGTDRHNNQKRDIKAQRRRIEQWGLHTLLLTERARRMHTYNLPLLACLYRSCTRIPGSSLGGPNRPGANTTFGRSATAPNPQDLRTMMEFNEFALSLKHVGFTRNEAYELELWLLHRQPQTARHLLDILTNIGLSANMRRADIDHALTVIRADLAAPSLPTYPDRFTTDVREYLTRNDFTEWQETNTPGRPVIATARQGRHTCLVHVVTDHAPTTRDLVSLCSRRLRGPRRRPHLVTTARTGRLTRLLATLVGVRTLSLGWYAVASDDRRAGESSHSRRL